MTISTRKLNQSAIYWAKSTQDGYGDYSYSAPVQILCKWEDKTEIVKNSKGEEVVSNSIVYVDREINFEDFLELGTLEVSTPASPEDSQNAYPVIRKDSITSINNTETVLNVRL